MIRGERISAGDESGLRAHCRVPMTQATAKARAGGAARNVGRSQRLRGSAELRIRRERPGRRLRVEIGRSVHEGNISAREWTPSEEIPVDC